MLHLKKFKQYPKFDRFGFFKYTTSSTDLKKVMIVRPEIVGQNNHTNRISAFRLKEAVGLVEALGHKVIESEIVRIRNPNPAKLFGGGKIKELKGKLGFNKADILMIDGHITPIQERNLVNEFEQQEVIDRFGIILKIFADRAETREAKLQVSLAEIMHKKTRLAHFYDKDAAQQRGGGHFIFGAGETNLEIDRRVLADKERSIKKELSLIQKRRQYSSSKNKFKLVSFVGYTNVGKSCLINALSGSHLLSEDKLFSSLNTHNRMFSFGKSNHKAIFVDTVGFVSELPTQLVASFRSTLERAVDSDLIVHVRDISSPESEKQYHSVNNILEDLGITQPVIEVWNKIDLLENNDHHTVVISHDAGDSKNDVQVEKEDLDVFEENDITSMQQLMEIYDEHPNKENIVLCSARNQIGFEALIQKIESNLQFNQQMFEFNIPNTDKNYGKKIHYLFENAKMLKEKTNEDSSKIVAMISEQSLFHFLKEFPDTDVIKITNEEEEQKQQIESN